MHSQPDAAAQKQSNEVNLHLVDQASLEVLLRDVRASSEGHVLASGGRLGLLERGFGSIGDERR